MKNLVGACIWLGFLAASWESLVPGQWECLLVLFAALVLLPIGFGVLGIRPMQSLPVHLLFASALGLAYLFRGTDWAAFAAAAYAFWAIWQLFSQLAQVMTVRLGEAVQVPRLLGLAVLLPMFSLGYWVTGSIWAFCYVTEIQPLGFDSEIVSLTAAHFHVAGFVLTTLVFAIWKNRPSLFANLLGWAAIAGMPLVAAGITATKLGFSPLLENVSAVLFAVMAFGVAAMQLRLSFSNSSPISSRILWLFSALSLLVGASLAMLYGLRFQFPIAWVNIPNLKIWHGTLNTLGFGWLGLLAWERAND